MFFYDSSLSVFTFLSFLFPCLVRCVALSTIPASRSPHHWETRRVKRYTTEYCVADCSTLHVNIRTKKKCDRSMTFVRKYRCVNRATGGGAIAWSWFKLLKDCGPHHKMHRSRKILFPPTGLSPGFPYWPCFVSFRLMSPALVHSFSWNIVLFLLLSSVQSIIIIRQS